MNSNVNLSRNTFKSCSAVCSCFVKHGRGVPLCVIYICNLCGICNFNEICISICICSFLCVTTHLTSPITFTLCCAYVPCGLNRTPPLPSLNMWCLCLFLALPINYYPSFSTELSPPSCFWSLPFSVPFLSLNGIKFSFGT